MLSYRKFLAIVKQVGHWCPVAWKNPLNHRNVNKSVKIHPTAIMNPDHPILVILAHVNLASKYVRKKWLVDMFVPNLVMIKYLSKFKIIKKLQHHGKIKVYFS